MKSNIKTYDDLWKATEHTWDCAGGEMSYVDTKCVGEEKVEYNIIFGNTKIVFIKAGAGGNVRGFQDKYIKMAKRINNRIGGTVICASNPDTSHEELDEEEIRWVITEKGFADFELYLIGNSDGAYKNLLLAKKFPQTVKFLGINASYITIGALIDKLKDLPSVEKVMVCGKKDSDSLAYVGPIQKVGIPNLKIQLIDGADHKFTGRIDEFIALADLL